MSDFDIGAKVRYLLPTMGLDGVGTVGATAIGHAKPGKPKIFYVALEAKDRALCPFIVKGGKAMLADGGKGTHRAFYAETLERITI